MREVLKNINKSCLVLLSIYIGILYFFGLGINQVNFQNISINNVEYNSLSGNAPVELYVKKDLALIENLVLDTRFINQDKTFSYGNIFQTSSLPEGIRVELQPTNKLLLILGEGHLYQISKDIQYDKIYDLHLDYKRQEGISIKLNGKEELAINKLDLPNLKLYLQQFFLGTGYGKARPFNGTISDFEAKVTYSEFTPYARAIRLFILPLSFFSFALIFLTFRNKKQIGGERSSIRVNFKSFIENNKWKKWIYFPKQFYLFPIIIAISGILIYTISYSSKENFGLLKWVPYIALPISFFIITILTICKKNIIYKNNIFVFIVIGYVCFLIFSQIRENEFNYHLLYFSLLTFLTLIYLIREASFTIAIVSCASWITIFKLTNWQAIKTVIQDWPFPHLFISSITIFIILFCILRLRNIKSYYNELASIIILVLTAGIFLFLSFRVDSLFIPGSEYHWEYFVGPIRTIRSGGWLLFNTPSQYGFLNILLASLIPVVSSWQALYLFQGIILFITALIVVIILFKFCTNNWILKSFIAILTAGSFYFADPNWIGPLPFPSSSVTRFFCCYMMIFITLVLDTYPRKKQLLAAVYSLGILWSAESAFYCSSIYLFAITADSLRLGELRAIRLRLQEHLKAFVISFFVLLILILLLYQIKLGYIPNFLGYFEYVIGYASGYGYVPFELNGPGNLLLLLFIGVGIVALKSIHQFKETAITFGAMSGAIWAVGSYYLGRPVPQNITALFPLLIFCSLLGIFLAQKNHLKKSVNFLIIVSVPLYFLVLATYYSRSWIQEVPKIRSFSNNIELHLPIATKELEDLISEIDSGKGIPRIFFGDSAVEPRFQKLINQKEDVWTPVPLQLLMPPISNKRREKIIMQYVCKINFPQVIMIHQYGAISQELPEFIRILTQYFQIERQESNAGYEVFLFMKKIENTCNE